MRIHGILARYNGGVISEAEFCSQLDELIEANEIEHEFQATLYELDCMVAGKSSEVEAA